MATAAGDVVVCSGYMNPLHRGHVEYLQRAKAAAGPGGRLLVILNSDRQAVLKHGYCFMPMEDRRAVVAALACVDEVVESVDEDRTVCETLRRLCQEREPGQRPTVFANAGDQTNDAIPEAAVCAEFGVRLLDGLGNKVQSSRWLISAAVAAVAAAAAPAVVPAAANS